MLLWILVAVLARPLTQHTHRATVKHFKTIRPHGPSHDHADTTSHRPTFSTAQVEEPSTFKPTFKITDLYHYAQPTRGLKTESPAQDEESTNWRNEPMKKADEPYPNSSGDLTKIREEVPSPVTGIDYTTEANKPLDDKFWGPELQPTATGMDYTTEATMPVEDAWRTELPTTDMQPQDDGLLFPYAEKYTAGEKEFEITLPSDETHYGTVEYTEYPAEDNMDNFAGSYTGEEEFTRPSDETHYDMMTSTGSFGTVDHTDYPAEDNMDNFPGSYTGEMESTLPSDETLYDMTSTGSADDPMYLMKDNYNSMYQVEDNNYPYHTEHNYNVHPENYHYMMDNTYHSHDGAMDSNTHDNAMYQMDHPENHYYDHQMKENYNPGYHMEGNYNSMYHMVDNDNTHPENDLYDHQMEEKYNPGYHMEGNYNSMYHMVDNDNTHPENDLYYNSLNPEQASFDYHYYPSTDDQWTDYDMNNADYNNYATEQASYDLYYPSEEPQFAGYDYNNYATEQGSYELWYPSEEPQFAGYIDDWETYETEHSYVPHQDYPSNEPEYYNHHMHNDGYEQEHDYETLETEHSYEPYHDYPSNEPEYDNHHMNNDGYEQEHGEDYDREREIYEHMPCLKDCPLTDVQLEDASSICEWWNVEGPVHNDQSCFNDCSPAINHVFSEKIEQMCGEENTEEEDVDPLECVMDCPIDGLNPHSAASFCPWFAKEHRNGCFLDCTDEFLNMAQEHAEHTCSEWEQHPNHFTGFEINEPMADAVAEENRDLQHLCPAGFVKRENRCEVCLAGTFSLEGTFDCIPCPDMLTSFPGSKSEKECFARGTLEPSN